MSLIGEHFSHTSSVFQSINPKITRFWTRVEKRYKKGIPPGFKDISKEEEERYGDLVLWYQIIDHATLTKKSYPLQIEWEALTFNSTSFFL